MKQCRWCAYILVEDEKNLCVLPNDIDLLRAFQTMLLLKVWSMGLNQMPF